MAFVKKLLDIFNVGNIKEGENRISEYSNIKNSEFENQKEQVLDFLQLKIEEANKLILIAKCSKNEEEFNNCINAIKLIFSELGEKKEHEVITKQDNSYNNYYENINKQKESNLYISYEDVKTYHMKPFNLNLPFISDGNFTAIELSGDNLKIAYNYFLEINSLLSPYKYLYEDADFPDKISIEYILNRKLPNSHLRLTPYTATKRKSKYPLCLWLSNNGDYGTEYIYAIYFDKEGNIGQCELSLHGSDGEGISYETKIRRNQNGLYILRISKTLYSPPYGTTTIYHCKDNI